MNGMIHEIDPAVSKQLFDRKEIILIDVREAFEYQAEHLPDAKLIPTSNFNPAKVPQSNHKKIVFYCATGKRSAIAAMKWREHYKASEAYSLNGGIIAWKKAGYPTIINCVDGGRIQSKAYLMAGASIILFSLLSFVYPLFLWLLLAVGIGFIISGASETGKAYLSNLISKVFTFDS